MQSASRFSTPPCERVKIIHKNIKVALESTIILPAGKPLATGPVTDTDFTEFADWFDDWLVHVTNRKVAKQQIDRVGGFYEQC